MKFRIAFALGALLAVPGTSLVAQARGFGAAIVIGDGEVIAGEPGTMLRPGTVYVYRKRGTSWQTAATLNSPRAHVHDGFGASLSLDGGQLYVGAAQGVHEFRKVAGSWRSISGFGPDSLPDNSGFGVSLAVSGPWALVGAPFEGERRGTVYVFRRAADGRWRQAGQLTAPDGVERDMFGMSVALSANTALVGAPGRAEQAGAVYAYRVDAAGSWQTVPAPALGESQRSSAFGAAVSFRGDEAVVGAPGHGGGYGAVFVFRPDPASGEWTERTRLTAFSGTRQDRFGSGVSVVGEDLWAGAAAPVGAGPGSAYAFHGADSVFGSAQLVMAARPESRARFGQTVAVRGSLAAVGAVGQDYGAGAVMIFERAANGQWQQRAALTTPADALPALTGRERRCGDDSTVDRFSCGAAELQAFLPVTALTMDARGSRLNDVWGWTDSQTGREYALVGRIDGTSFVDVSDPVNPVFVGELLRTPGTPAGTWRDIKVYRDHAFIVADGSGEHGMQVFDLTQLRNVRNPPVRFTPTAHYTLINSAHNIVVNEESGFAYSVGSSSGGEMCGGGLHMIDIRQPARPAFAGCFADIQTGRRGTGYTHDAQCVMYRGPDARYRGREICVGANENALSIGDVTDKSNPRALSRAGYPNHGYAHQGWFTEDQRYFFMNDEGDELDGCCDRTRTMIWDLSDLENPTLAAEYMGETAASDHNLYIKGDLMYQSNYRAGLRIIDISEPLKPVEVGYFDTAPYLENTPGFSGTWSNYPFFQSGTILVTSVHEGLFLVKKRPTKPVS